jgi:hypothetical protein
MGGQGGGNVSCQAETVKNFGVRPHGNAGTVHAAFESGNCRIFAELLQNCGGTKEGVWGGRNEVGARLRCHTGNTGGP